MTLTASGDPPGPAAAEDDFVRSPCVRICTLDPTSRLCLGCGRSIAEIARWGSLPARERREVLQRIAERRALGLLPPAGPVSLS